MRSRAWTETSDVTKERLVYERAEGTDDII